MANRNISHVIFDMDGLLLDTEPIYTQTTQEIVGRQGKTFTWEVKSKLMGSSEQRGWEILFEELQLTGDMEAMMVEARERRDELFPHCSFLPGAERLVRHLHAHNVPICVATSSRATSFEAKTMNYKEMFALFSHCVKGDDPALKAAKPAPDIFLTAASRFPNGAPDSKNVLVFEDAPAGVEAALAAKMNVIMVPDKNLDKTMLGRAHVELSSLEEFNPAEWGLPPYPSS